MKQNVKALEDTMAKIRRCSSEVKPICIQMVYSHLLCNNYYNPRLRDLAKILQDLAKNCTKILQDPVRSLQELSKILAKTYQDLK